MFMIQWVTEEKAKHYKPCIYFAETKEIAMKFKIRLETEKSEQNSDLFQNEQKHDISKIVSDVIVSEIFF